MKNNLAFIFTFSVISVSLAQTEADSALSNNELSNEVIIEASNFASSGSDISVEQEGVSNFAFIDSQGNNFNIIQNGVNHSIDATGASGPSSSVSIEQISSDVTPDDLVGNEATISQSGFGSTINVFQDEETTSPASVAANEVFVTQSDLDGAQTLISQKGKANKIDVLQVGFAVSGNASSSINQLGDEHTAEVIQEFAGGTILIEQEGFRNKANVNQLDGTFDSDSNNLQAGSFHVLEVNQEAGVSLVSNIEQTGFGVGNMAIVNQTGFGNISTINQINAEIKLAEVTQSGEGNSSIITQSGFHFYEVLAKVEQSSENNLAIIDQQNNTGQFTTADIVQNGFDSKVEISQLNSDDLEVNVNQLGLVNAVRVKQFEGELLTVDVNQDGLSNSVEVEQSGLFNRASINQNADFYQASIIQSGENNSAEITQEGFGIAGQGASAAIIQSGIDNRAEIIQLSNDNSSIKIEQTGGDSFGETNRVKVTQNGGVDQNISVNQGYVNF